MVASLSGGEPEDIFIVCDMAHVADLPRYAKQIYIVNKAGKAVKAPVVSKEYSTNWLQAWESNVPAIHMVELALNNHVDRKTICLAVCKAVRALSEPRIDDVPFLRESLDLVERYCEGVDVRKFDLSNLVSKIGVGEKIPFSYYVARMPITESMHGVCANALYGPSRLGLKSSDDIEASQAIVNVIPLRKMLSMAISSRCRKKNNYDRE